MTTLKPGGARRPGKKKAQGILSRQIALEILLAVERDAAYANLSLNAAFKRNELSERDRAFVTALVQGVLRNRMHLDEQIALLSKEPLSKLAPSLLNVLRLAIFQLENMADIPASAVLNTSNELAKSSGHKGHAKFANGVLRSFLRNRDVPKDADSSTAGDTDPISRLSLDYSVPEWLVRRWMANFGEEEAKKLLEFARSTPTIDIRTCDTAITPEGLEQILKDSGVACHRGKLVNSCFVIDKKPRGSLEKLVAYQEGLFSIQDEAAAFVSLAVEPKKGELIVDLCAAPGGKSLHMAEMLDNSGRVLAVDKSSSRLDLIKANRTRLGLKNIETVVADGRTFKPNKLADRVLLDAPCTGTGVINKRSDLRYQRDPIDIEALTKLQKELLANAATIVKPGGILVYATCSLEPEENFDNIRWFLKEFQNFEGDDLSSLLPAEIAQELSNQWQGPACKTEPEMTRIYMIQLMPSRHSVSGFFVARLRRKD